MLFRSGTKKIIGVPQQMKCPTKLIFTFLWVIQLFGPLNAQNTPQYEWDLSDIYADTSSWQSALDQVSLRVKEFENLKGSLGNNAQSFLAVMREYLSLIHISEPTRPY